MRGLVQLTVISALVAFALLGFSRLVDAQVSVTTLGLGTDGQASRPDSSQVVLVNQRCTPPGGPGVEARVASLKEERR